MAQLLFWAAGQLSGADCRMVEQLHLLTKVKKVVETKIKEGQKSLLFILILTYFLVVYITRFDPQFLFKLLQNNHSEHQITRDKSVKIKVNSVGDRFASQLSSG